MLFPINSSDKSVAGYLICLIITTIHEPKISLIDHPNEITRLSLNRLRRPNRSLRFETGCVIRWENSSPVRTISVHHDNTITAGLALFGEDGLQISDLILSFARAG